jgi:hypothetical protein
VCGLPEALSATETRAVRAPNAAGVNVTAMLHVAPAKSGVAVRQSFPLAGVASRKSPAFAPVIVTLVIVREPVPLFVRVEVFCVLAMFSR